MPETSPRLALPMIQPAQAQKHVTHNAALAVLDTLTQLVLEGTEAETPPSGVSEGETWALGPLPTGDWDGHSGQIAAFQNTGWTFLSPQEGWRAWDKGTSEYRVYTGGLWHAVTSGSTPSLQNLTGVGIGATSDAINRLSVSADATLLNNAGTGHQLKINKSSTPETASLLFQTNWSGRAEMGTSGSDDFAIKVSDDGNTFTTGLSLKADSGIAEVRAVSGPGVFIADDTATLLAAPSIAGFVLITVSGSDPRSDVSAILVQDTGSTPALQSLFATPLVDLLTGVLTGTSATDGALGISAVTGGLWIENRLGSGQTISLTFMGGL